MKHGPLSKRVAATHCRHITATHQQRRWRPPRHSPTTNAEVRQPCAILASTELESHSQLSRPADMGPDTHRSASAAPENQHGEHGPHLRRCPSDAPRFHIFADTVTTMHRTNESLIARLADRQPDKRQYGSNPLSSTGRSTTVLRSVQMDRTGLRRNDRQRPQDPSGPTRDSSPPSSSGPADERPCDRCT